MSPFHAGGLVLWSACHFVCIQEIDRLLYLEYDVTFYNSQVVAKEAQEHTPAITITRHRRNGHHAWMVNLYLNLSLQLWAVPGACNYLDSVGHIQLCCTKTSHSSELNNWFTRPVWILPSKHAQASSNCKSTFSCPSSVSCFPFLLYWVGGVCIFPICAHSSQWVIFQIGVSVQKQFNFSLQGLSVGPSPNSSSLCRKLPSREINDSFHHSCVNDSVLIQLFGTPTALLVCKWRRTAWKSNENLQRRKLEGGGSLKKLFLSDSCACYHPLLFLNNFYLWLSKWVQKRTWHLRLW